MLKLRRTKKHFRKGWSMRNRDRSNEHPNSVRAQRRKLKNLIKKEMVEFLRIQNHYFPNLIEDIKKVMDARHQGYIEYEIEVVLFTTMLKNVCSIVAMQEMSEKFDEGECKKSIYRILGIDEKKTLPHYVTINECLAKLDTEELEKVRKKMIYNLIRKKSFDGAKFLNKYWLVIVDGTQLFCFKERHCEHCLTKTINKGTSDEKTIYYHHVLEAKIVLGDDFIVSIATEFIENPTESPTKQDCETKAFKRLAESLKKMFPKLPICLLADSLYASAPVFSICSKNKWEFLIHYKEGSIPTLAEEYREIKDMGESEEETVTVEEIYKRKPRVQAIHKMKWVNDLEYQGHKVSVMELEILIDGKKRKTFQWITSQKITHRNAPEFATTGRKRWMVENEGFNIQKNIRYFITHANSLNYNAMKNHYLLTQLADVLLQLYERGIKGLRIMRRTLKDISAGLLESLRNLAITSDDLDFERMQVRKEYVGCG